MKAEFIGRTLVVTPESDRDREELKYYGGPPDNPALWECFGWEEDEQSWSAQGLCPAGLQDWEVLNRLRYMMELDEKPFPVEEQALRQRFTDDMKIMDGIRQLLGEQ